MTRPAFLTRRQREILAFIRDFHRENGISPTHREICEEFGYSSYGTVHKHLKLLVEKGFLRKASNQKRGIEPVPERMPEERRGESGAPVLELPFLGRIAAGRPVESIPGDEHLSIPDHLVGRGGSGQHYILRVVGESMIDEGIFDGDLVVVQRREEARAGEMVVALVGEESTLKRFYPEGARVRLQPANPHMEPLLLPADEVRIQGIVIGLMRRF